jgi:hypothetical protein
MATKAKLTNHISQILADAGRSSDYNNRSFFTKSLNSVLDKGLVKIEIQQVGKIWQNAKVDHNFNLIITGFGRIARIYIQGKMEPREILLKVGGFLNSEHIKKQIGISLTVGCSCERCNGNGIIKQFHYYCAGICFECFGSGRSITTKTI